MYYLNLMDSTSLPVHRINPSTFETKEGGSELYDRINDNLALAFLSRGDGLVEEIYIDYCLQNFICCNNVVRFRIGSWDEVHRVSKREKRSEKKFEKQVKEGVIKWR